MDCWAAGSWGGAAGSQGAVGAALRCARGFQRMRAELRYAGGAAPGPGLPAVFVLDPEVTPEVDVGRGGVLSAGSLRAPCAPLPPATASPCTCVPFALPPLLPSRQRSAGGTRMRVLP